jgi:hypothetical protein
VTASGAIAAFFVIWVQGARVGIKAAEKDSQTAKLKAQERRSGDWMSEDDQQSRYQPRPMDISDVTVPDHLRELSEMLAENAHEVWAAQRMSDGWQYGPSRDDNAKQHPCLVPYDRLPESEKKYDRSMVDQTMRCILKLGYQLLPLDGRDGEGSSAAATQR